MEGRIKRTSSPQALQTGNRRETGEGNIPARDSEGKGVQEASQGQGATGGLVRGALWVGKTE